MKKLVLATLMIGGLAQATGCIITSGDDDPGDGFAQFRVGWTLTAGENDNVATCPPGATTAQVVTTRSGTSCNPNSPGAGCFVDLFNCADGENATALIPLGSYDVFVNITDTSTATLFAQSFVQGANLSTDGSLVPVNFTFPVDGGFFELSWTLSDAGGQLSCADEEIGAVSVLATLIDDSSFNDDIFRCEDGSAITGKQFIGDYTVVVSILDELDDSVVQDADPIDTSIDFGNEINDLGVFNFLF
jgi:hypothetical protein